MAFMSQFTKIRYLDPNSHISGLKTEFRLPKNFTAYPNLRLGNLGVSGTATEYDRNGVISTIRHIHLYSNQTLIDSARHVNRYMSFKNRLTSNEYNKNILKFTNRSKYGYEITNGGRVDCLRAQNAVDAVGLSTNLGVVDLPDLLGVLLQLKVVDTSQMPNLRLVIEYEDDKRLYLNSDAATDYKNLQPVLICDEIVNPQIAAEMVKQNVNISFQTVEHDSVQVPAVTVTGTDDGATNSVQPINKRLKGNQNKVINRCVLLKSYTDKVKRYAGNTPQGQGNYSSPVQIDEKINFLINGRPVFDDTIEAPNVKLMVTEDAFGPLNLVPYEAQVSAGLDVNQTEANNANREGTPGATALIGFFSPVGFKVLSRVRDIEIQYERRIYADANGVLKKYADGLDLHLYSEVQRVLKFGPSGPVVTYL
mgnify:FL=1